MKRTILILFISLLTFSARAQIVVPMSLPDNCNINVGERPVQNESFTVKILPNPNSGFFTLYIESPSVLGHTQIEIYNSVGIKCLQVPAYSESGKMIRKISVDDLPDGVYFLKVYADKQVMNVGFTVKK